MQQRCKNAFPTIKAVFSAWSVPRIFLEDSWRYNAVGVQLWSVNQRATEPEEYPLLRFVARKRLVKTQQRNSIELVVAE
jgi:hypothetical protein